ncbi:MAG: hypothetical protein MUD12_11215 [Spirochaetes bacterium]|jgi:hypothetical protein|nr:hypothetical protein [Spirochaetota bacterium]
MAKVDLNPVFEGFSKKIGELVFYTKGGMAFVRRLGSFKNPNSPKQLEVRNRFMQATGLWKTVGGIMHRGWYEYAKKKRLYGYPAFIGENTKRFANQLAPDLFKEHGEAPLSSFTCEPSASSGEIMCSFTNPSSNAEKHVTLFAHEKLNGQPIVEVRRIDLGLSPASPHAVSGFEPGKTYTIHAVVTDRMYPEAESSSASLSHESLVN